MKRASQQPPIPLLVVEDSPTQALQLAYFLEQHGYSVATAADGHQALSLMAKAPPAAVISDVVMPGMDGYTLCRLIKRDPALKETPVVLLTALGDPLDVIHALECGADCFIGKGAAEQLLLSRLECVLNSQEMRRQGGADNGICTTFSGQAFNIQAAPERILDLLLSTYEGAHLQKEQLLEARQELRELNEQLERKVRKRTAELQREMDQRKAAERQAQDAYLQINQIFNSTCSAMRVIDTDCNIIRVNAQFLELTGKTEEEIYQRKCYEVFPGDLCHGPGCALRQVLAGEERLVGETVRRNAAGNSCMVMASPLRDDNGTLLGVVESFNDVNRLKDLEKKLHRLANFDPLTNLPNEALFEDRLAVAVSQAKRSGRPLAVINLVLHGFRQIKDTLGSHAADETLKAAAQLLRQNLPETATLARATDGEFLCLLAETAGADEITGLIEPLLKELDSPFDAVGRALYLRGTAGIALFPADASGPGDLIRSARSATHQIGNVGRGQYRFFSSAIDERAKELLFLEAELRQSIEGEEFVLYYQPQFDLASGRLIGLEALVRWQQPQRGLVSPLMFIPLAERTGLISQLGEWVLRSAVMQNRTWQKAGLPPLQVAVNVSSVQLKDAGFVEQVAGILAETGLPAECLELEFTESVAMEDVEATVSVLNRIKELGVSLALDDFGTGFSSLSYLKRLPVDRVKIDRSFIANILDSSQDQSLVAAIIAMTKGLNLKVLCEGVETAEQLVYLKEAGCDEVQGYVYGRPAPAEEIERLFLQEDEQVGGQRRQKCSNLIDRAATGVAEWF